MKTGRYYYKPQLIGDGSPSLSRGTPAAVTLLGVALLRTQVRAAWPTGLCSASPPGWIRAERLHAGMGSRARGKRVGCTLFVFLPATGKRSLFIQEASFALFVKCHMVAVFHVFFKKKFGIQQYLFKVYLVTHIIKKKQS